MTTAASAPASAMAAVIWMVARVDSQPDPASTSLPGGNTEIFTEQICFNTFLNYNIVLQVNKYELYHWRVVSLPESFPPFPLGTGNNIPRCFP